jgi:hypothetical protein
LDAEDKDQEATKEDSRAAHFLFSASFLFVNSMFNNFYHRENTTLQEKTVTKNSKPS